MPLTVQTLHRSAEFWNFIKMIPLITIFDEDGKFRATGLVTPPPEVINPNGDAIDLAVAIIPTRSFWSPWEPSHGLSD